MREITLKVKHVELLLLDGMDELFLHLDIPTSFPTQKFETTAQINCEHGCGEQWCKDNLLMTPKIVNIRTDKDEPEKS